MGVSQDYVLDLHSGHVSIAPRQKSWSEEKQAFILWNLLWIRSLHVIYPPPQFGKKKKKKTKKPVWLTEASFLDPAWWEVVEYTILEGQCGEFSVCYTATQIFSVFWSVFYVRWKYTL